jgi:hypothetical protein
MMDDSPVRHVRSSRSDPGDKPKRISDTPDLTDESNHDTPSPRLPDEPSPGDAAPRDPSDDPCQAGRPAAAPDDEPLRTSSEPLLIDEPGPPPTDAELADYPYRQLDRTSPAAEPPDYPRRDRPATGPPDDALHPSIDPFDDPRPPAHVFSPDVFHGITILGLNVALACLVAGILKPIAHLGFGSLTSPMDLHLGDGGTPPKSVFLLLMAALATTLARRTVWPRLAYWFRLVAVLVANALLVLTIYVAAIVTDSLDHLTTVGDLDGGGTPPSGGVGSGLWLLLVGSGLALTVTTIRLRDLDRENSRD